jgi:hypothetical protein
MDQIHRLLQESIFCYRKLMEVYERLRKKISTGGSSEKLNALLDQSRELNTMVQYVDGQFQKLASDNQVTLEDLPLFSRMESSSESGSCRKQAHEAATSGEYGYPQ